MQIYAKWPWAPERIAERRNTVGTFPEQGSHDKPSGQEQAPAEYRNKNRRHTAHTIVIFQNLK